MFQNHMLQMLMMTAMHLPKSMSAANIRNEKRWTRIRKKHLGSYGIDFSKQAVNIDSIRKVKKGVKNMNVLDAKIINTQYGMEIYLDFVKNVEVKELHYPTEIAPEP